MIAMITEKNPLQQKSCPYNSVQYLFFSTEEIHRNVKLHNYLLNDNKLIM